MNIERVYRGALRAYPAWYRVEHGEEMLSTLLEASAPGMRWVLGDVVDLTVHGLQRRTGLTADSAVGRAMSMAAVPGLAMAATFSVIAFFLGDEVPSASGGATFAHFGPFATIGPAVYLVWLLAALAAFSRGDWLRRSAAIAVVTSLIAIPIGATFFARPPMAVLLLPAALALPGVLAPSTVRGRSSLPAVGIAIAVTVGLVLWADVSWASSANLFSPNHWWYGNGFSWLYQNGIVQLSSVMPYVGAVSIAAVGWFAYHRRWDIVGAISMLLAPWLLVGALSGGDGTLSGEVRSASHYDAALAVMVVVFGAALWLGRRRSVPLRGELGAGTD